jgi:hypothetical protein
MTSRGGDPGGSEILINNKNTKFFLLILQGIGYSRPVPVQNF